MGDAPAELHGLLNSASQYALAVGVTIEVSDGAEFSLVIDLADEAASAVMLNDLHTVRELARRLLNENRQAVVPYLPILQPLVENLVASSDGNVATLRTRLSREGVDQLNGLGRLLVSTISGGAGGTNSGGHTTQNVSEQAVPSAAADGLPEGMKLSMASRWKENLARSVLPVEMPPNLELVLLADEGPTSDVVAYGNVQLSTVRLDGGGRLKRSTDLFSESTGPKTLHIVRRDPFLNPPGQVLSIPVQFYHPVGRAETVSELSGRVLLRIAGRRLDKQITNLRDWVGHSGDDADLKAASFEVIRSEEGITGNIESLVLLVGPQALLTGLAVGEPGSTLEANSFIDAKMLPDGRSQYTISFSQGRIPDVVPARFQLATDLHDHAVAFQFEDVPLPKGQPLSPEQQVLVTWNPTLIPDKVPEGMSLEARARWSLTVGFDAEGKQTPRPLEIAVDAVGEKASRTVAYGKLSVSEARTKAGPLELATTGNPFLLEAQQKLIAVEREFMLDEYPPDGMQAVFSFNAPEGSVEQATLFAGSFTLVTAASQKTVRIPDILTKKTGPFTTPQLESHGIELQLLQYGENLTVSIIKGLAEQIADIRLVDQRSLPLPGIFGGRSSFGGSIEFSFSSTAAFPEKASLEITVNEGLEYHKIPFRFENLPIPPRPQQPERIEF